MAAKKTVVNEMTEAKKSTIDYGLVSRVLRLWGVATALQGVIIIYTMTTLLITNVNAGTLALLSTVAFPYELNAVAGVFNLFFGIALFALGQKAKNW